jgi:hypothetical protein
MANVRIPLTLPGPGGRCIVNARPFTYPKRVPITTEMHCAMTRDPEEARQFYVENGIMARRKRDRDGCVVYRLPWRLWRHRNREASGDWRLVDPNEPMVLMGIALIDLPGLIAGASGFPGPTVEAQDA